MWFSYARPPYSPAQLTSQLCWCRCSRRSSSALHCCLWSTCLSAVRQYCAVAFDASSAAHRDQSVSSCLGVPPSAKGGATSCFEGIRLLRLPRVANVVLTLGLVLSAARATISGVYAEILQFVQEDKQRIDESFTALLQDTVLSLLDPARIAAPQDSSSWLACVLPDGARVEPWTPEPDTRGNEGCLSHRIGGTCACAGTLFRVDAKTGAEVRLDTYGYETAPYAVGLSEFMLVRARHCIWPESTEQAILGASVASTGGTAASLSDWWAGQAFAVLENTLGILILVAVWRDKLLS